MFTSAVRRARSNGRQGTGRLPRAAALAIGVPLAASVLVGATSSGVAEAASTPPSCPCSLFSASSVPTNAERYDPNAVEVGVQFESSIAGIIRGVRFYKGPDNTGAHVGSLWTAAGTLLAQATFTNETATGWQEVDFSTPVPIAANTTYVAGYHTNTGYYSYDSGYFANSTLVNGPLSAVSDAAGTPNGVFAYSPTPVFPTDTYNGNNYWVDVVMAAAPTGLQVTETSTSLAAGTSEQLSATESFSDGTSADVTSSASWSASNGDVAVSASGLAHASAVGTGGVTATIDGLSATVPFTVTPPVLTSLVVSAPSSSVPGGASEPLTATAAYSDGSTVIVTNQVSWTTSTPTTVSVSSTGTATGLAKGPASVTASLAGVSATSQLNVLAPAVLLVVSPALSALKVGQSEQLTATALLSDGTRSTVTPLVTWAVHPSCGLVVTGAGLLTAVSPTLAVVTGALGHVLGAGVVGASAGH